MEAVTTSTNSNSANSSTNTESFSLYYYNACPFCQITLPVAKRSSLNIELRNIQRNAQHRSELISQGGSPQVPCLRIDRPNEESAWLYESADIIHFLRTYEQMSQSRLA